jgi:hypothetical protein
MPRVAPPEPGRAWMLGWRGPHEGAQRPCAGGPGERGHHAARMLAALEREAGQPWSVGIARKPRWLHRNSKEPCAIRLHRLRACQQSWPRGRQLPPTCRQRLSEGPYMPDWYGYARAVASRVCAALSLSCPFARCWPPSNSCMVARKQSSVERVFLAYA